MMRESHGGDVIFLSSRGVFQLKRPAPPIVFTWFTFCLMLQNLMHTHTLYVPTIRAPKKNRNTHTEREIFLQFGVELRYQSMSSDLSVFDDSFFTDPFPCNFNIDSPIDILPAIHNYKNNHLEILNPLDEIETNHPLHQISPAILFSSSPPPSSQLEQTTHLSNSPALGVKEEEFQFRLHSSFDYQGQGNCQPHSYGGGGGGAESTMKMMQRSYSSHSFDDGINASFMYQQPQFGTPSPMESHTFVSSSPENSLFTGQLRKACSTGDLHVSSFFILKIQIHFPCFLKKKKSLCLALSSSSSSYNSNSDPNTLFYN